MSTGAPGTGHAVLGPTQLDIRRYERTLCVTRYARPEILAEVRPRGVEVVSLARKHRYDLRLHAHKHGSSVRAGLLKLIFRIPVFFAHRHSWPFAGDFWKGDVEAGAAEPALPESPTAVERKLERLAEDLSLNDSVHFSASGATSRRC